MSKSLYEILVPTVRTDIPGRFFRKRFHKVWDAAVNKITGGLTVLTPVKGNWVSTSGELVVERMIPVRIACTAEQIEQIADMTAKMYQQKAIFYYRVSDFVVIKYY
jgi:hypothetical protein